MSVGTQEETTEASSSVEVTAETTSESSGDGKRKRTTYSLQEKLDVIDYLRARVEPVVGKTKVEIAALVAEAAKIPHLDASALWGIIDSAPKANLGAKVGLIEADTPESLGARVKRLEELLSSKSPAEAVVAVGAIDSALGRIELIEARLATIEDRSAKSFNTVGTDIAALRDQIADLALRLKVFKTNEEIAARAAGG